MGKLRARIATGDLRDSPLAPMVLEVLVQEPGATPVENIDWLLIVTGIAASDRYFVRVQPSAGQRDWQRDLAQIATPMLVAISRSLNRSPDAQAAILKLCEAIAARLRLRLVWPRNTERFNDLANAIYSACLRATELESDEVLAVIKQLQIVGPS